MLTAVAGKPVPPVVPALTRPGPCPASAGPTTPRQKHAANGILPGGSPFASLEEAQLEVAYYLDTYFNLDRRHSALGYRSPHQFEQDLQINLS